MGPSVTPAFNLGSCQGMSVCVGVRAFWKAGVLAEKEFACNCIVCAHAHAGVCVCLCVCACVRACVRACMRACVRVFARLSLHLFAEIFTVFKK